MFCGSRRLDFMHTYKSVKDIISNVNLKCPETDQLNLSLEELQF